MKFFYSDIFFKRDDNFFKYKIFSKILITFFFPKTTNENNFYLFDKY